MPCGSNYKSLQEIALATILMKMSKTAQTKFSTNWMHC